MFYVLLIASIVLLYLYVKIRYFTLRGPIPGLSPYTLFGNLIQGLLRFKKRFGDVFQFWLGSLHVIIVANINDVQHIFNHRNIYEHGDMFVQRTSVLFPDGLICLRGKFTTSY